MKTANYPHFPFWSNKSYDSFILDPSDDTHEKFIAETYRRKIVKFPYGKFLRGTLENVPPKKAISAMRRLLPNVERSVEFSWSNKDKVYLIERYSNADGFSYKFFCIDREIEPEELEAAEKLYKEL